MSGIASIMDPAWVHDKPKKKARGRKSEKLRDRSSSLFGGLALIGWGFIKLSVVRFAGSSPEVLHRFARFNALPMMAAIFMRRGSQYGLPGLARGPHIVLAGLYACVGLGLRKIPRPGNDRFPDRFLEYMPEKRMYLA